MRRFSLPAAVTVLLVAAAPAVAAPGDKPSRWAHAKSAAPVHSAPGGKTVGRLHLRTEDDFREVYLVAATKGKDWVKVRIPVRPNGSTGWVKRSSLTAIRTTRSAIVVDGRKLRITLYEAGDEVWSAPGRHRHAVHPDARGQVLDPRGLPGRRRRQRTLRPVRDRHVRLLGPLRLARRRRHRPARHRRALAHPRQPVARLRAPEEQGRPLARHARPDRDAGHHQVARTPKSPKVAHNATLGDLGVRMVRDA